MSTFRLAAAAVMAAALTVAGAGEAAARSVDLPAFTHPTRIDNPYAPLTEFGRCVLIGHEGRTRIRVMRRALDRTKAFEIEGRPVEAAVIKDTEYEDGELVERTFDYFAQGDDGTVFYLGEDVDNYEDGRVVDHEGSWLFGRDTDTPGVNMPARPRIGDTWRNEDVPGITVERDKLVDRIRRVRVRGEVYRNVIRVRERSDGETEFKLYAKGVGNIQELPPGGVVELDECR